MDGKRNSLSGADRVDHDGIHPDAQDAAARIWLIAWYAGLLAVTAIACLIWAVLS